MSADNKPLRIIIVSDAWHPQVNGVVRTYEHITDELKAMGHEVLVVGPADFPMRMPLPGYSEIQLALFPRLRLAKMIREFNPNHLHVATEGPLGWAARNYAKKKGIHFTTSYHTHFPDYIAKRVKKYIPFLARPAKKLAFMRIRRFHNSGSAMFVATNSLERDLKRMKFEAPMYRLTRGVKIDQFQPGEKNLFHDLPQPVALYVGRVAIEKSIHKFLEMDWKGSRIVVGDGPSMSYFKKRYPDAHFVGKKEGKELADHYRSSDVFVFPSKTDTFGIVIIEALACGIPVAGYDVTGPQDILTEPYLGAIDDDLGTATQKALLVGNPEQRHAFAKENYSWREVANQFVRAIHETA
ncbi:MAG: glycosyltransferase family 1 protein [Pseudomonadota bacterium]